jgi:hypothetical protein
MATIAEEIQEAVAHLPPSDQQRVLAYVRSLAQAAQTAQASPVPHTPLPPGTPGSVIANLRVSPELGEALERALEDTERIDYDGWR